MPDGAEPAPRLARLHGWCDRTGLDQNDPLRLALAENIETAQEAKEAAERAEKAAQKAEAAASRPVAALSPDAEQSAVDRLVVAASSGAERRAGELAKVASRRTLPRLLAFQAAALVVIAGLAFLAGGAAERRYTASVGSGLLAAFRDPDTAAAWLDVIRGNDIRAAMRACAGQTWTAQGRRACAVPLWLDPASPAPAPRG